MDDKAIAMMTLEEVKILVALHDAKLTELENLVEEVRGLVRDMRDWMNEQKGAQSLSKFIVPIVIAAVAGTGSGVVGPAPKVIPVMYDARNPEDIKMSETQPTTGGEVKAYFVEFFSKIGDLVKSRKFWALVTALLIAAETHTKGGLSDFGFALAAVAALETYTVAVAIEDGLSRRE